MIDDEELREFAARYFGYDDHVMLYRTTKLENIENSRANKLITMLLEKGGGYDNYFATLVNAIVTQENDAFGLSRRAFEVLLEEDQNHGTNTIHSRAYSTFMRKMRDDGFWKVQEKQVGRQPGLYVITDPLVSSIVTEQLGEMRATDVRTKRIRKFYTEIKKQEESSNVDADVEYVKELRKRRLAEEGRDE